MVECVMALCIILLGVLALLSTMPTNWSLAGGSDMRTHAAEILHKELEDTEIIVLNPCNTITVTSIPSKTVYAAGQPGQASQIPNAGDATFTLTKTIVQSGNGWLITVQVLWTGTSTGITESRLIMKQDDYQDNTDCATVHANCDFTTNSCS